VTKNKNGIGKVKILAVPYHDETDSHIKLAQGIDKTFRGEDYSPNESKIPHKESGDANSRSGGNTKVAHRYSLVIYNYLSKFVLLL